MKKKHIAFTVFAVLLAALIGVSVWQQDNIRAVIYAMTTSSNELLARQKKAEAELRASIEEKGLEVPEIDGDKIILVLSENKPSREIAEQIMSEAESGSGGALAGETAEAETDLPPPWELKNPAAGREAGTLRTKRRKALKLPNRSLNTK
jgi:hypothetical protein